MGVEFKPVLNFTHHFSEELPFTEDEEEVLGLGYFVSSTLGYFAKGSARAVIL